MKKLIALLMALCMMLAILPAAAESMQTIQIDIGLSMQVPRSWNVHELQSLDQESGRTGDARVVDEDTMNFTLMDTYNDNYGTDAWEGYKKYFACDDALMFNNFHVGNYISESSAIDSLILWRAGNLNGQRLICTRLADSSMVCYFVTCQLEGDHHIKLFFYVTKQYMGEADADDLMDKMLNSMKLNGKKYKEEKQTESPVITMQSGALLSCELPESSELSIYPFSSNRYRAPLGKNGGYNVHFYPYGDVTEAANELAENGIVDPEKQLHLMVVNDSIGYLNVDTVRQIGTLGDTGIVISSIEFENLWMYNVTARDGTNMILVNVGQPKDEMTEAEVEKLALKVAKSMTIKKDGKTYTYKKYTEPDPTAVSGEVETSENGNTYTIKNDTNNIVPKTTNVPQSKDSNESKGMSGMVVVLALFCAALLFVCLKQNATMNKLIRNLENKKSDT